MIRTLVGFFAVLIVSVLLWWILNSPPESQPVEPAASDSGNEISIPTDRPPTLLDSTAVPHERTAVLSDGENATAEPSGLDGAGAFLTARILDEEGNPLEGATLGVLQQWKDQDEQIVRSILFALQGQEVDGVVTWTTRSDSQGYATLELPNLKPKSRWEAETKAFELLAFGRAEGYEIEFESLEYQLDASEYEVGELRLVRGSDVTIKVVNENQQPLDGVLVLLLHPWKSMTANRFPYHLENTDADGLARFPYAGALAESEVEVYARGYVPISKSGLDLKAHRNLKETLVLRRGVELQGRVVRQDGQPAPDIEIKLMPESRNSSYWFLGEILGQSEVWATTDGKGHFSGDGIDPDAKYRLRAMRSPKDFVETDWVRAGDEILITLPATHRVNGRVLTQSGEPAAGAFVRFFTGAQNRRMASHEPLLTDQEGRFSTELKTDSYWLMVWHEEGELLVEPELQIRHSQELPDFRLDLGARLEIKVFDQVTKKPVPGAKLRGIPDFSALNNLKAQASSNPAALENFSQQVLERSDLDRMLYRYRPKPKNLDVGHFLWAGLPVGSFRLGVTAPNYTDQTLDLDLAAGRNNLHEVSLIATASLTLIAQFADGSPAAPGILKLRKLDTTSSSFHASSGARVRWNLIHTSELDANRARFSDLSLGSYEIVEKYDFGSREPKVLQAIDIQPGENEQLLIVTDQFALRVYVGNAQGAVEGATVRPLSNPRGPLRSHFGLRTAGKSTTLETDADGWAELPPMPAGEYEILASRPGGYPQIEKINLISPHMELHFQLDGLQIQGRVLNAPPGAEVICMRQEERPKGDMSLLGQLSKEEAESYLIRMAMTGRNYNVTATCDEQGQFHFKDLAPGSYQLRPDVKGSYVTPSVGVRLTDQSITDLQLEALPASKITLHIDGLPQATPGKRLFAELKGAGENSYRRIKSISRKGKYDFDDLPAGDYILIIGLNRRAPEILQEYSLFAGIGQPVELRWNGFQ